MWQLLVRAEGRQITYMSEARAQAAAKKLVRSMEALAAPMVGIAQRHGAALSQDRPWEIRLTGLVAALWIDPSGRVGWVTPRDDNETFVNADLTGNEIDRSVLLKAGETGKPSLTREIALPRGGSGFHLVIPVRQGGRLDGFLVGVFSTAAIYPLIFRDDIEEHWTLAVLEDDRELWRVGSAAEGSLAAESRATVLDSTFRVRAAPGPDILARLRNPLPSVVLAAGSAIALLLAVSVGLAQSSRRRARQAEGAQAGLRESEGRMRSVLNAALDAAIGMDAGGLVVSWNPQAETIFGWTRDEAIGRRLSSLIIPHRLREAHEHGLARLLATGEGPVIGRRIEMSALRRDDSEFPVELTVTALKEGDAQFFHAFVADIAERKRLEAQLLQSQKMESVGRLAGGVAHDFNNLLGVITGYGELLRRHVPDDTRLRKYVDDILRAAARAADLTRQLLAFSRQQVLQLRILDLNAVVAQMETMLRRLIGEDIQFVTIFDDHLAPVKADPGQIEQVLMNLAVNARDAMPRGGCLTIETANTDLDAAYARSRPGVEPGPHVMLAVSDTGQGMDPETLSRIFEPFFTTKEAGKGTGLGLATVHGIVKQCGGHIFVYSEPKHGTTFKIYLPRVERTDAEAEAIVTEPEPQRGFETVMLVEDEESLRDLVRECLEVSGYSILEARHAGHALEIAEEHTAPIHLMITDVVMPGMSGRELAEHVTTFHAETRVLYMSGYTDDAVILHGILVADVAFLQKPFTAEMLARKVREVLDHHVG
jgi:PAS domain S-box-containing protein